MVVNHLLERAGLFKILPADTPLFLYLRPVHLVGVNRFDFCGGSLHLDAVFVKHLPVGFGVVEHFRHRLTQSLVVDGRHLEYAEGGRVLRLTHKVGDECLDGVLPFGELDEFA